LVQSEFPEFNEENRFIMEGKDELIPNDATEEEILDSEKRKMRSV
jgi:hypothetical protein